jgi:hypothetical protein
MLLYCRKDMRSFFLEVIISSPNETHIKKICAQSVCTILWLLSDAEFPKNRMQNIIRRDVARDLRKMIQGLADVYSEKVGWDAEGHAV